MVEYCKAYYQENKEKMLADSKIYRETHLEQDALYHKQYYEENKEKVQIYIIENMNVKNINDPIFRLKSLVAIVLRNGLKANGGSKMVKVV